jgi:hypothetical protein
MKFTLVIKLNTPDVNSTRGKTENSLNASKKYNIKANKENAILKYRPSYPLTVKAKRISGKYNRYDSVFCTLFEPNKYTESRTVYNITIFAVSNLPVLLL